MGDARHRISDVDAEAKTGWCLACGCRVDLYLLPGRQQWECRVHRRARKSEYRASEAGKAAARRHRAHYQRPPLDPESAKQWRVEYYSRPAVRERVQQQRRRQTLARHGLTVEKYDAIVAVQGGVCAICGCAEPLVVDHDHATGCVRELLCNGCNRGIGFLRENERILLAAIDYLRRHPTEATA